MAARAGKTASLKQQSAKDVDVEDLGLWLKHGPEYHRFTDNEVSEIRTQLLKWYDGGTRRKLPWRGDPPPWSRTADNVPVKKQPPKGQTTLSAFFKPDATKVGADNASANGGSQSKKGKGKAKGSNAANGESEIAIDGEKNVDVLIPLSPYGTWVSEIMLQQTRVETVIDYYAKWMKLFPNVEALAAASPEEVNSAWAGLGYYRRARFLHEGAKAVVSKHNGVLPPTVAALKAIPGIGPYTAGAISSIAFGRREPLVDGNVIRVLSRLRAIAASPKSAALTSLCWELAGVLVPENRAGDFNQSLMELGATICTPQSPSCNMCPLSSNCKAKGVIQAAVKAAGGKKKENNISEECSSACVLCQKSAEEEEGEGSETEQSASRALALTGLTIAESFPLKAVKAPPREELWGVTVVVRGQGDNEEILLVRRPPKGLLAGQWECPSVQLDEPLPFPSANTSESAAAKKRRSIATHANVTMIAQKVELDVSDAPVVHVGVLTHVFSHVKHTMIVDRIQIDCYTDESTSAAGAGGASSVIEVDDEDTQATSTCDREVRWMNIGARADIGITAGTRKVLAAAAATTVESAGKKKQATKKSQPKVSKAKRSSSASASSKPAAKRQKK